MPSPRRSELTEMVEYLTTLSQARLLPDAAQTGLRPLQQRYPSIEIELLWEQEAYDHSMHYDLLLYYPGEGTVSLSFCPEQTLPWPMRGVHRWSEVDCVRVNNTLLTIEQAVGYLDFAWEDPRIRTQLVNACLIQATLDKEPVVLSDAELQRAMDGFRRAHKLYKAEDTHIWLEHRGLTHTQFEQGVANAAMVAKLRDRITVAQVQEYFEQHQADFATASIACLTFNDAESARHTATHLRTGAQDFYGVAQQRFLMATRPEAVPATFAVLRRGQAPLDLSTAVFAATPGAIVGPVHTGEHYTIARVLAVTPACLDQRTSRAIQHLLFEDWLAERRRTATIQWYWGKAQQTAPPAAVPSSSAAVDNPPLAMP